MLIMHVKLNSLNGPASQAVADSGLISKSCDGTIYRDRRKQEQMNREATHHRNEGTSLNYAENINSL